MRVGSPLIGVIGDFVSKQARTGVRVMEAYIVDWLNLLGRWVHIVTGIAWIGASFYFVFLDMSLEPPNNPDDVEKGVGGEIWSVHGGGFYHAQKYRLAPARLPETLHWFKWEAYSTWLSGIFLLGLVYWYGAEIYLIDPNVMALSKGAAIGTSVAFLAGGWLIYDLLCKSAIGNNENLLAGCMVLFVIVAAFSLCQVFSGRGAYIMFGAVLGTIMAANVFFVIIPGQKDLVSATREGREPDPVHGIRGKQRSVHNTYFTLPVLFVMISNHYAMTYGHAYNWLVLIAISLAGALIRVFFVSRHGDGNPRLIAAILGLALLALLIVVLKPQSVDPTTAAASNEMRFATVREIIEARCATCHAAVPTQPGFVAAPKGVVYDTDQQIREQMERIHQQAVVTRVMPIANLTGMTDEERAVIGTWYRSSAPTAE